MQDPAPLDVLEDAVEAYRDATRTRIPAWALVVAAAKSAHAQGCEIEDIALIVGITPAQAGRMLAR